MPALPLALLVAALTIAPPAPVEQEIPASLSVRTERVEAQAVRAGLELRVGESWRRWSIDISDAGQAGQVNVQLRDDAGHTHVRTLDLEGDTLEERNRALASSLALIVEQLESGEAVTTSSPTPPPERAPISGFVGVGPRLALNPGSPPDIDVGASLAGGAWLVRDHLLPLGELAWARGTAKELEVDALRIGAGALGGAPLAQGRLWGGGGALMRAQWTQARATATAAGWWASPAVVGALQYRGRLLVLGLWIGADLVLPPMRARGDPHAIHWFAVRPMATLHIGLRLPPRPARPAGG